MRRRERIEEGDWRAVRAHCPLLGALEEAEDDRVRELAEQFLGHKSLESAGGLELDARMAASIAAQACVPLIGLDLDWYTGWHSVIVYPGDFVARHEHVDEAGVVHETTRELAGESWDRGPIVLSWETVEGTASGREWGNVVIHECAHKLDLLEDGANGAPPMAGAADRRRWAEVMSQAFAAIGELAGELDPDDVLAQAAEDPAEFFAVLSE